MTQHSHHPHQPATPAPEAQPSQNAVASDDVNLDYEHLAAAPEVHATDANAEVAALQQKVAELSDNWLRAKAETENVRRRAQEDVAKAHKFAVEKFANELLAVKDSLEAALSNASQSAEALHGGVELTLKQLVAAFEKSAIKEVNPLGEKFDPHQHQAIQTVVSEQAPNTVAQVLQKGYLIADRVLRPALVLVSKGPAEEGQGVQA